jgi:hypothetical protein
VFDLRHPLANLSLLSLHLPLMFLVLLSLGHAIGHIQSTLSVSAGSCPMATGQALEILQSITMSFRRANSSKASFKASNNLSDSPTTKVLIARVSTCNPRDRSTRQNSSTGPESFSVLSG